MSIAKRTKVDDVIGNFTEVNVSLPRSRSSIIQSVNSSVIENPLQLASILDISGRSDGIAGSPMSSHLSSFILSTISPVGINSLSTATGLYYFCLSDTCKK